MEGGGGEGGVEGKREGRREGRRERKDQGDGDFESPMILYLIALVAGR